MYYVVNTKRGATTVRLSSVPETIKKQYQLSQGISRLEGWPGDVTFKYAKDKPEGMELLDWVDNSSSWMIISERFRKVLEGFPVDQVEYLPVLLQNHKGKIASTTYCIGNFTKLTEAVDRGRSAFKEVARIMTNFEKLVLRDDILKSGAPMFRLKERDILVLAREDLVKRLKDAGMTGVNFVKTDDYKTFE